MCCGKILNECESQKGYRLFRGTSQLIFQLNYNHQYYSDYRRYYYLWLRGYVFVVVCVSVSPCVCVQNISKSYERISMKFLERWEQSIRFGGNPDPLPLFCPNFFILNTFSIRQVAALVLGMYALYWELSVVVVVAAAAAAAGVAISWDAMAHLARQYHNNDDDEEADGHHDRNQNDH